MRCIDCAHVTSGNSEAMARSGFSQCGKDPEAYRYLNPRREHECKLAAPAAPEDIEKRITWWEKQNG